MKIKTGDIIAFAVDMKSHIGRKVLLKANTPVKVISINNSAVMIRLPSGEGQSFRNMPERMYKFKGKIARTLFE